MVADGLITLASSFGPKETMDRLEVEIKAKGMTVFARIDHAAGAEEVDLPLRPTELLIFGNAKAGTPLMQANQPIDSDPLVQGREGFHGNIAPRQVTVFSLRPSLDFRKALMTQGANCASMSPSRRPWLGSLTFVAGGGALQGCAVAKFPGPETVRTLISKSKTWSKTDE